MTPIIYTRHSMHGCQFITHNIFSSWPLSHLSACVYIEGNVPLLEVSVSRPRRQTLWYFQEKYAAGATARDSCPCAWHVSQSVCASPRPSLSPHTSAVISQTMAIYDKVPLRAICQENLWDGGRRDGWGEWQGNDGGCTDSPRNKRHNVCTERGGEGEVTGVCVCVCFRHHNGRVQETAGGRSHAPSCLSEPWHYKGAQVSQDVTTSRAGESSSDKSACAAARSVHQLHRCSRWLHSPCPAPHPPPPSLYTAMSAGGKWGGVQD